MITKKRGNVSLWIGKGSNFHKNRERSSLNDLSNYVYGIRLISTNTNVGTLTMKKRSNFDRLK
jgi:hypothetical protein